MQPYRLGRRSFGNSCSFGRPSTRQYHRQHLTIRCQSFRWCLRTNPHGLSRKLRSQCLESLNQRQRLTSWFQITLLRHRLHVDWSNQHERTKDLLDFVIKEGATPTCHPSCQDDPEDWWRNLTHAMMICIIMSIQLYPPSIYISYMVLRPHSPIPRFLTLP